MSGKGLRQRAGVLAVLAAMALVVLDAGIVNVALPTLALRFHVPAADAVQVVAVYQVALVALLLPCAHASARIGQRRLFSLGIAAFCGGAVACALAPTLGLLLMARSIQGAGAAAVMSLGIALLRATLGEKRLADAVAWNAMTVALCSAAGPVVGALILAWAPLPVLFLASAPVGVVAFVASRTMPKVAAEGGGLKPIHMALYVAGIVSVFGVMRVATMEPAAAGLAVSFAIGCLVLLLAIDRRASSPFLPLDLMRLQTFRRTSLASVCCFTGQSLGLIGLPFLIVAEMGLGPKVAGTVLFCWPASVVISSAIARGAAGRADHAVQAAIGAFTMGCGLALCWADAMLGITWLLVPAAVLCGAGFGLFQIANNRAMFGAAAPARAAAAGGVQSTARLTGQGLGSMVMAGVLAWQANPLGATQTGFLVGAGFALASGLVSGTGTFRGWSRSRGG